MSYEEIINTENNLLNWSLLKRIFVSFIGIYLFLYGLTDLLGNAPYGDLFLKLQEGFWNPVVVWTAKHIFHISDETIRSSNAAGSDTLWKYVYSFSLAIVSFIVSISLALIGRERVNYQSLYEWTRRYVRYVLGLAIISYGVVKVIKTQFLYPSLDVLSNPVGMMTPSSLLWAMMGISVSYNLFTGIVELLGGVLLFFRRTTMLGALLCVAIMSNVVMLNFGYDVPVKIFSTHLLLMSIFLAAPYARKLISFFLMNHSTESTPDNPPFQSSRMNKAATIFAVSLLIVSTAWESYDNLNYFKEMNDLSQRSLIRGIWVVEEFELDGKTFAPNLTDTVRWHRVVFDYPEVMFVQTMDASRKRYFIELNDEQKLLSIGKKGQSLKGELIYERTSPDSLTLTGSFNNQQLRAKLRLTDEKQYSRIGQGFHWIHETTAFY